MTTISGLLAFFLFITTSILAVYGPKSWLKLSMITALLFGFALSVLLTQDNFYPVGLYLGLFLGLISMAFSFWAGYWVRRFRGY